MRPGLGWEQAVRETRRENELKLQTLGLVDRHDLHRVATSCGGLGVVGRAHEQRIQRPADVRQQRFRPVKPFIHILEGLEAVDGRAQVGHRLGALAGVEPELEELANGPVLDEHRVGKARQRQPFGAFEQPVARGHRSMKGVVLGIGEVLVVIRRGNPHERGGFALRSRGPRVCGRIRRRLATPGQWITLRILGRKHVHEPPHDARERSRLLECVGAQPAERPRADAAKA